MARGKYITGEGKHGCIVGKNITGMAKIKRLAKKKKIKKRMKGKRR